MGWVFLGLIGYVLVMLLALILVRMAGDSDRAAREEERMFIAFAEGTVTLTP